MLKPLIGRIAIALSLLFFAGTVSAATVKEWTVLVFLNGHNNLDSFGQMNVDQMAQVGSSDQVNLIVQWASLKNGKTKRIYVEKGSLQIVEELPPVDMGDYKQLVEFTRWAHAKYPAKKYFVDVWNHGSGWHLQKTRQSQKKSGGMQINDISYDDITGNHITTEQLAIAMSDIAKLTGSKIELYASDACLMAMAEVATQMADSVKYFAGSQETEPGEGWPYHMFLAPLVAKPTMDGAELAKILSKEYLAAYSGGVYGTQDVTFSAYDLSKMQMFNDSVKDMTRELLALPAEGMRAAAQAIDQAQSYAYSDYKDFSDYLKLVGKTASLSNTKTAAVQSAMSEFVIANDVSAGYSRSSGVSIWLPNAEEFTQYGQRYSALEFNRQTGWADFITEVLKSKTK